MPRIIRPQSNIARNIALRQAKNRKDAVPAMPVIPYSAGTIVWLDTFQALYKAAFDAVSEAKQTQTNLTAQVTQAKKLAIYNEQDFVLNLNRAIRRELFIPSARTYYNIALDDDKALKVTSESQITDIKEVLDNGETNRLADGGTAITFPSIAQVNTAVNNFISLNDAQSPAKLNFDMKQEAVAAMNEEADKLILKLWNETETAFDEGDKASMRRKCRDWGVVYLPSPGEAISPDDFSIIGKVTDSVTGAGLNEVQITIVGNGTVVITDSHGDYFIGVQPPATYTLQVSKIGYLSNVIPGVVVTAGVITTLNIQLVPGPSSGTTGTVSGQVTVGAGTAPATVSADGTGITTTTDPLGNYTLNNVPQGMQTIRAVVIANPANFQTQSTTVIAAGNVTVNFSLP